MLLADTTLNESSWLSVDVVVIEVLADEDAVETVGPVVGGPSTTTVVETVVTTRTAGVGAVDMEGTGSVSGGLVPRIMVDESSFISGTSGAAGVLFRFCIR